jgi:hypothetical protein
VVLAVNAALLFFVIFPKRSDIANWSGIVIKLQKDIYELSRRNREVTGKQKMLQEATAQILDFKQSRLGYRTSQMKKIMETIDDLVYRFNLRRGRTTYNPVQIKNADFEKMRIQFIVQGSYQSVRYFINALERSPLFFVLTTLTLMSNQSEESIQLGIGIETYFMKTGS